MSEPVTTNYRLISRDLGLPLEKVQLVIELLDEGHPVPFIARYRKDETGNLNEDEIRAIFVSYENQKQFNERKNSILRMLETSEKLTPELDKKIREARTPNRLEDLYLPYKTKKQSLAAAAREKGLEPLALSILSISATTENLDNIALPFINEEKGIKSVEEALVGAGYILSEKFNESIELRQQMRDFFYRSGKLVSKKIVKKNEPEPKKTDEIKSVEPSEPINAQETETASKSDVKTAAVNVSADNNSTICSTDANSVAVAENASVASTSSDNTSSVDISSDNVSAEIDEQAGANLSEKSLENSSETEQVVAEQVGTEQVNVENAETKENAVAESVSESASELVSEPASGNTVSDSTSEQPAQNVAKPSDSSKKKKNKKSKQDEINALEKVFSDYFDFSTSLRKIPSYRVLALNRGERAKILNVKIEIDKSRALEVVSETAFSPEHPFAEYLKKCLSDALNRLLIPSLENEIRRNLSEQAEGQAISVFAKNLKNLLLQKPLKRRRVLAVDPGFRHGCKLAALDEFGNVLGYDTVYLTGSQERKNRAGRTIAELINKFHLSVVAIGNGTGCRETEDFFAKLIADSFSDQDVCYIVVNEAGASVYSASPAAKEEFPNYDLLVRGSISIGRRLQDPLNELVKIEPGSLGVGMYQHDVKAKNLKETLTSVVESTVNYVGVDLNSATPAILRYVAGLNQLTATRIYEYRMANGPFRKREQLLNVSGIGESAYLHSAGFLKIADGYEPFDATWIHPESYELAAQILEKLGFTPDDLRSPEKRAEILEKTKTVQPEALAAELNAGILKIHDILTQLTKPGRDPREELPAPIFKKGIMKIEDLTPGMELTGTVLNVVDFGAFVDVGLHDSGLIHISQMGDSFVNDAHERVSVGDIITVWVVEVDANRHRISLTMLPPGTERVSRRYSGDRRNAGTDEKGSENQGTENQTNNMPEKRASRSGEEGRFNRHRSDSSEGGNGDSRRRERRNDEHSDSGSERNMGEEDKDRSPRHFSSDSRRTERFERRDTSGRARRDEMRSPRVKTPRVVVFSAGEKKIETITDSMKQGKEPMRSFSDLAQLFGRVQAEEEKPQNKKGDKTVSAASESLSKNVNQPIDSNLPTEVEVNIPTKPVVSANAIIPESNVAPGNDVIPESNTSAEE